MPRRHPLCSWLPALGAGVLVVFVPLLVFGGQPPSHAGRFVVSGKVKDASTGQPLPLVNVFIAQSTIGAASDSTGSFHIRGIPEGQFELVASRIGYRAESVLLRMPQDDGRVVDFDLEPTVVEVPAIEVRAEDLGQWREDLERFCHAFLGTSANARQSKILNPEVLGFTRDQQGKVLQASASAPLEIINRGLGYRIHAVLISFSVRGDASHYQTKAQFTQLEPADPEEERAWEQNRLRAYRGSFRHFLNALVNGTTKEEGFSVWRTPKLYSYRQSSYDSRSKQMQLFSPAEDPFTLRLHFPGFLKVVYILEPDEFTQGSYQVSLIKLARDTVLVNLAGYAPEPADLVRYGRWSHDRLAEQLPFDYVPPR
ncbi:MAG: carboxypeptidase-like regulatory domain-containing protein [Calditrichaeota bacterium]|nr:carboxypeptidase-like regulatory domain-containing protein [Calditrichota bacterium]